MFRFRRHPSQKPARAQQREHDGGRQRTGETAEFERRLSEEVRRYEQDLRELAKS
jgi:hypothetical protein